MDISTYRDHEEYILKTLFSKLIERGSAIEYVHFLLNAVLNKDREAPLWANLPFIKSQGPAVYNITRDELKSRRLQLISSKSTIYVYISAVNIISFT